MKTVSVYGYGRFGKFWADILSKDFKVKVYSRRGLKPEEVSEGHEICDIESIFDCDAMFFSVAISAFEGVLKDISKYARPETIFFDTCSVKVEPVNWMLANLPQGAKIIATHPMFGPDSYFEAPEHLPMVMSNISVKDNIFEEWTNYFATKKMRVEIMTPDEHDKIVAYSQGVTHFIGRVLGDLKLDSTPIGTLGYDKLLGIVTQTCNDSWQLFLDLQKHNPYTKQMRSDLNKSLEKIYSSLEAK